MKRFCTLLLLLAAWPAWGQDEPAVDLLSMPQTLRPRNISSRGLGCCTFRSAEYAARWQGVPQLYGLPEWMREQGIAGGGWPAKEAEMIRRISEARRMPVPRFVQYEGNDTTLIEMALKTNRLPGITWNGNHMLSCVYLDQQKAAILDNNDPHRLHWYSRAEFMRRYTAGGGGWCVVLLDHGPTPPPRGAQLVRRNPPPPPEPDPFVWDQSDPYEWKLRDRGGKHLGSLFTAGTWQGQYRRWLGNAWSEPCDHPCPAPLPRGEEVPGGVVGWTPPAQERYWIADEECDKSEAIESLTDDSAMPWLTLIGPEAERALVLHDLDTHPALVGHKARWRLKAYEPNDWAVEGFGFATGGKPTIYLQDSAGKVLWRQDSYEGAEQLAETLRRRDPNYDPTKDPGPKDPVKPEPAPVSPMPLPNLPPWLSAVVGALLIMILNLLNRKAVTK